MAALIACPICKKKIASDAQSCPNCAHVLTVEERDKAVKEAKSAKIGCLFFFLIVIVGSFIWDTFFDGSPMDFSGKTPVQMAEEIKKLDSHLQQVDSQTIQDGAQLVVASYLADVSPNPLLMEAPAFKEILRSVVTAKGNPFGGVILVLEEPATDQWGNKGQGHTITLGWNLIELQKANWENFTESQALDLATVMAVGSFGKDAIDNYCKDGATSYAEVFCNKVGYGR